MHLDIVLGGSRCTSRGVLGRDEVEGVGEGEVVFLEKREKELGFICFIELLCDTDDILATGQSPSLYTFSFHMLTAVQ